MKIFPSPTLSSLSILLLIDATVGASGHGAKVKFDDLTTGTLVPNGYKGADFSQNLYVAAPPKRSKKAYLLPANRSKRFAGVKQSGQTITVSLPSTAAAEDRMYLSYFSFGCAGAGATPPASCSVLVDSKCDEYFSGYGPTFGPFNFTSAGGNADQTVNGISSMYGGHFCTSWVIRVVSSDPGALLYVDELGLYFNKKGIER